MATRKILVVGNPLLRQKARPVKKITKSERRLIDDLFETMEAHEGIGLAAPQIGVLKRIFVARWEGEHFALIDPVIEWVSRETVEGMEGCLSIPGVQGNIRRPLKIRVRALNEEGNLTVLEPEGWLARIFQHEIDHLDGILILDRTDELYWVTYEVDERDEERIRLIPTNRQEIMEHFTRLRKKVKV